MGISKFGCAEFKFSLDKLETVIDLSKDLPVNIFKGDGCLFWFFERPILCFFEVFSGLISNSVASFCSEVLIKFSGGKSLANSCFSIDGTDVEKDVAWLSERFESFFGGTVGYPIVLFEGGYKWVAFESAYEEFGVIAVKESALHPGFRSYLNSNFLSIEDLAMMASGSSAESKTAKHLISSYG